MSECQNRIDQEAASWFLRVQNGLSESERRHFNQWLQTSEAHHSAYRETSSVWNMLDTISPESTIKKSVSPNRLLRASRIRNFTYAAVACLLLIIGMWTGIPHAQETPVFSQVYQSQKGEIATRVLPDGTKITLDTDTKIKAAYYDTQRNVILEQGQIMVEAAKDPGRILTVQADTIKISVTGTCFEVRHIGSLVRVTVEEGSVEIAHAPVGGSIIRLAVLNQSQQILLDTKGIVKKHSKNENASVATWRKGRLTFNHIPLGDVISEYNRYGGMRIQAGDAKAQGLLISGTFDINRTQSFLDVLPVILPVSVTYEGKSAFVRSVSR